MAGTARALGIKVSTLYGTHENEVLDEPSQQSAGVADLRSALDAYDDPRPEGRISATVAGRFRQAESPRSRPNDTSSSPRARETRCGSRSARTTAALDTCSTATTETVFACSTALASMSASARPIHPSARLSMQLDSAEPFGVSQGCLFAGLL
ncbi:hypothetical protein [Amycolatopsis sp. GA6-003]|uniref:hypothetical protein n=1 Tax=Amycolatopsis sp. GA6-003 TaxID=2652444 RepID=UPI0039170330